MAKMLSMEILVKIVPNSHISLAHVEKALFPVENLRSLCGKLVENSRSICGISVETVGKNWLNDKNC